MLNKLPTILLAILGISAVAGVSLGVIKESDVKSDVNPIAFEERIPMVQYSAPRVVDISSRGLSLEETKFVQGLLDGKIPAVSGHMSSKDIEQLYFDSAVKMGLKPEDAIKGANLYDFIRK